jgi:hypothetical protein
MLEAAKIAVNSLASVSELIHAPAGSTQRSATKSWLNRLIDRNLREDFAINLQSAINKSAIP